MDIIKFLSDHHIDYDLQRPGWVQIHCPFGCGYPDYHLGINLKELYGHCWRCRGHSLLSIIQQLLNCSWSEAGKTIRRYETSSSTSRISISAPLPTKTAKRKTCVLPYGTDVMTPRHRWYLEDRNFDPELLEKIYDLRGTGHLGEYAFRIIAPIYYKNKIVSFQGRDITNKGLKYLTCSKDKEVIHHKHILYGLDLIEGNSCVVVEGITDKWRLGPGAVATFGTGFTIQQAKVLASRFDRVFALFDPEQAAQETAQTMLRMLNIVDIETIIIEITDNNDPGDMKQDDADALMREINLKGWN